MLRGGQWDQEGLEKNGSSESDQERFQEGLDSAKLLVRLHDEFDLRVKSRGLIANNYTEARNSGGHDLVEPAQSLCLKGHIEEDAPVGGISKDHDPHDGIVTEFAALPILVDRDFLPVFYGQRLVGFEL